MSLHILAPAKLNLFLTIMGRREDGYHLLDSLFVFVGLADGITVEASETLSFALSGPFATNLECGDDNIVMKAAAVLRREACIADGARICLDKHIPLAAGLGGGSADAAAVLCALNDHWRIGWPLERLEPLAARLGADVPACLAGKPVMARGIGEHLTPAPAMPDCAILLVNPGIATPTPQVFKAFRSMNPEIALRAIPPLPARFEDLTALVETIGPRGNDLLPAAIAVTPMIAEVLAALTMLPGAAHAGLCGSGATCFALFESAAAATRAAQSLRNVHPSWWSWSGTWAV